MLNLQDGMPCGLATDCLSASCVDGVCCDQPCNGVCVACTATKKGSGADGVCGNIAAATDPDSECDSQQIPCDGTGLCDGAGACTAKKPLNFPCAPGSCTGNVATNPSVCDGGGKCLSGGTTPCALGCAGPICMASCSDDTMCAPNGYCLGGTCASKQPIGGPCAGASQCSTGFCVDGVCCDAACNGGPCQACVASKGASSDGTCTPLNGPAPAGKCDDGVACTDDVCSGGSCAHPAKVCPAASACHVAPTCDPGTGKCGAETPTICPTDGLGVCETRLCDVTANGACVVRSRLDGAPCKASGSAGICVAGSCFTVSGTHGSGGAGGAPTTSSAVTAASATSGASGDGGAGGSGGFHFAGGACSIVNDGDDGERGLVWIVAGLLFASRSRSRSRSRRAASRSRRGSRDA